MSWIKRNKVTVFVVGVLLVFLLSIGAFVGVNAIREANLSDSWYFMYGDGQEIQLTTSEHITQLERVLKELKSGPHSTQDEVFEYLLSSQQGGGFLFEDRSTGQQYYFVVSSIYLLELRSPDLVTDENFELTDLYYTVSESQMNAIAEIVFTLVPDYAGY